MDIHPWTKYEIGRLRDEERLLRARDAMRAVALGETYDGEVGVGDVGRTVSWRDRILRRRVSVERPSPAGSGAV
jgi:hypothetical protein